ncbi:diguanylate cyclase [Pararhizobium sp. LjRoot235]|uniref:GGDEF domain-containing protein n=1 Tax=Pararhizobium sp. LjRoot235 TaxID=3342291 RepID=UPI003ECC4BD1
MSFPSAIAVIALAVMLPVLLLLRKSGVPGVGSFYLACVLSTLSAGAGLTSTIAPPWFDVMADSTLTVAASLAALNGFRGFLGRKQLRLPLLVATLACMAIILGFFSHLFESRDVCVAFSAGLAGLIYFLTGIMIMRHWSRQRAIAPYVLFCCVSAFAVAALNAFRAIAATTDFGSAVEPQMWVTALVAARQLMMPLFLLGVVLLLHGWMIANLRHLIAHDELTGALSRRAFMAECERISHAASGSGRQTAFMLLDLDRFKQINDQHGHAGGDAALGHFTRIAQQTLAGRGMLGRLGGEEFGIVLAGVGRTEVIAVAEAICTAVRTTPASAGKGMTIALTVSIGIAIAKSGGALADLMMQADVALYEAKAMGRDRLSIADSLGAASSASARALAGAAAQMRAAAAMTVTSAQPLSNVG